MTLQSNNNGYPFAMLFLLFVAFCFGVWYSFLEEVFLPWKAASGLPLLAGRRPLSFISR